MTGAHLFYLEETILAGDSIPSNRIAHHFDTYMLTYYAIRASRLLLSNAMPLPPLQQLLQGRSARLLRV